MRLCLAAMPWLAVDTPSLPVGILRQRVSDTRPSIEISEFHGGVRWAEYMLDATAGRLTPNDYARVADKGLAHGLGGLESSPVRCTATTAGGWPSYAVTPRTGSSSSHSPSACACWPGLFVELAATEILSNDPTSSASRAHSSRTDPSLAAARLLKRRRPGMRIVMGGANCDGPQGAALHRNYPFLDYVVRGEGEAAFPALLDPHRGVHPAGRRTRPVLARREGCATANPMAGQSLPPAILPAALRRLLRPARHVGRRPLETRPETGAWRDRAAAGGARSTTARSADSTAPSCSSAASGPTPSSPNSSNWRSGTSCWTSTSSTTSWTWSTSTRSCGRWRTGSWDLRLHFEVKANLRRHQFQTLADSGAVQVQPGIESLEQRACCASWTRA